MLLIQHVPLEADHHAAMKGCDLTADLTSCDVAAQVLGCHSCCSGAVVTDQLLLLL